MIRPAVPEDAADLIAYVKALVREPGIDIPLQPHEFTFTVEEEQALLAQIQTAPNNLYLIAEADGQIVGEINLRQEAREAWRHIAVLGMSVERNWRNRGLGSALLVDAISWARANPVIRRLELSVYSRNKAAIHLYEKHGFVREGIRRGRIFEDGQYLDDWIMARWLA